MAIHRKSLFTGQILYFRHMPPKTNLDSASEYRPLSPPFKDAPRHMCSMYFYWWAFLRENEEYISCCKNGGEGPMEKLYRDFGDVSGTDFMDWWIDRGRLLFCEPLEDASVILTEIPRKHDNESRVLISVPIHGDIDRIVAEIRSGMGEYQGARGNKERPESRARYQPLATAKLQSLHRQLGVYQAKKKGIGHKTIAHDLDIGNSGRNYNENAIVSAVSRYYAEACAIVRNVGKGRFPDYSDMTEEPDLFG
ncbi:MAG: hypothetical protein RL764_111 [Pseudomonadota bacterium]|jgi:hypothetical protein